MIYSEAVITYMVVSDFISLKPFGCLNVVSELCIMYASFITIYVHDYTSQDHIKGASWSIGSYKGTAAMPTTQPQLYLCCRIQMHTMKVLTIVLIAFAVAVIQPVEAQILCKSIYV